MYIMLIHKNNSLQIYIQIILKASFWLLIFHLTIYTDQINSQDFTFLFDV